MALLFSVHSKLRFAQRNATTAALYVYPHILVSPSFFSSGTRNSNVGPEANGGSKTEPRKRNGYFHSTVLSRHYTEELEEGGKVR
ncbi:hypothetical protein D9619_011095 [Psilocybe cf. subviscida]|uniref:Uncharacterized protein n=1 Tax=Psilocybe cf. subviscida TaxID=2480587 RepID=A0A8H5BJA9_9AGAR|nr:hypothetical protein D9619_011095 [Psilocybe cf. subviscida]